MKTILTLVCLALLSVGCKNTNKESSKDLTLNDVSSKHSGKKLMETNCYACHSPTADHDNRIAPPMIAVKKHYLKEGMTKEAFINSMQTWLKNPTEDNAKMYGAVKKFGVMPKQVFPEETIRLISDYMYSNYIEQPAWFEDHFNSKKGKHGSSGTQKGKGKRNQRRQKE